MPPLQPLSRCSHRGSRSGARRRLEEVRRLLALLLRLQLRLSLLPLNLVRAPLLQRPHTHAAVVLVQRNLTAQLARLD